MDSRVKATQEKLVSGLRQLMLRYPWQTITIATICQESQTSRSTFYSHFETKDELMQLSLEFLARDLAPTDTRRGLDSTCTLKFLPGFLNHVKSHRGILLNNVDTAAAAMIHNNIHKTIEGLLQKEIELSDYVSRVERSSLIFICGGLFAIVKDWNDDGYQVPTETILAKIDTHVESTLLALK